MPDEPEQRRQQRHRRAEVGLDEDEETEETDEHADRAGEIESWVAAARAAWTPGGDTAAASDWNVVFAGTAKMGKLRTC